jgi:hypothetical protein
MSPHISFYGFKKKSSFGSKSKGVGLRSYRKNPFCGKN